MVLMLFWLKESMSFLKNVSEIYWILNSLLTLKMTFDWQDAVSILTLKRTIPSQYSLLVVRRDILERGRNVESVLAQYERFVKPSFDDHVSPVSIPNN